MMNLKKPQIVALGVAILAIVLLLLLPRTEGEKSEVTVAESEGESIDYREHAISTLSGPDREAYNRFQEAVNNAGDPLQKIDLLDSLSRFWDERNELLMAADELYFIAEIISDKASYFIAGDKYFGAFGKVTEDKKALALQKSINCYEAVLEMNPEDLEAMTSLGVCYVEGSTITGEPPMKGIGMLRKVLEMDPNNINAIVNLGYFATKSGQYDKAIERFKRVIEIDPQFSDGYLYLSEAYLQAGNNEEAAKALEEFKQFIQDPAQIEQLENYIEQIRNNNI